MAKFEYDGTHDHDDDVVACICNHNLYIKINDGYAAIYKYGGRDYYDCIDGWTSIMHDATHKFYEGDSVKITF